MEDDLKLDGETGDGNLRRDLNAHRASGQLCDVVLVSGQYRTNAHRLVLATKSPYFLAMFSANFSEKEMAEVSLTDSVDGEILETLIEYFYLEKIAINETNAPSLLAAADLLLMPKLKAACWRFLKSHVTAGNSLRMWSLATKYSDSELMKKARECTLKNFEKVAEQEDFLELLDLPHLLDLLNDDRLMVKNGQIVYRAAMRWVRYREDYRKAHLADILKSVRLPLCGGPFLWATVRTEALIRDSDECQHLVDAAIHQWMISIDAKHPNFLPEDLRRKSHVQTLYAIGGTGGGGWKGVEKYTALTNAFSAVTSMSAERNAFACAVLNERIMVIGGVNGNTKLSSVECYDPLGDKWSSLPPLAVARHCFGAAVMGDHIYAVGGQNSSGQLLSSMERYDPVGNSWTTAPPMPTARWLCETVALDGQLYVLGGSASASPTPSNIVEIFNQQTDAWSTAPPMRTARDSFGCVVYGGRIFVAGGYGGGNSDSSVESFDPVGQQWSDNGKLSSARYNLSLAVVDERLLAIGGNNGSCAVTTVEEYLPETNTWRHLCDMTQARDCLGVAVVTMA